MKPLNANAFKQKSYQELYDEYLKPFDDKYKERLDDYFKKHPQQWGHLNSPATFEWEKEAILGEIHDKIKGDDATQRDRAWSLGLQNQANEYNEYLSGTAYQRAAQDMQAAGLNPGVMFAGGAGSASSANAVLAQNDKAEQEQEQHSDRMDAQYMQGIFSLLGGIIGGGLSAAGSLGGAALSSSALLNSVSMKNATHLKSASMFNKTRQSIANSNNAVRQSIANSNNAVRQSISNSNNAVRQSIANSNNDYKFKLQKNQHKFNTKMFYRKKGR